MTNNNIKTLARELRLMNLNMNTANEIITFMEVNCEKDDRKKQQLGRAYENASVGRMGQRRYLA